MTEWISVNDSMPKVGEKVLTYCKAVGGVAGNGYIKVNYISMHTRSWECSVLYGYEITHWMPLPEPPKEEG